MLNLTFDSFSHTHVSGDVIKNMLMSIIGVTFTLDACKVSFISKLFVNILKKESLM